MKPMIFATILALTACRQHPESHTMDLREMLPTLMVQQPRQCSICISIESGNHKTAAHYHTYSADGSGFAHRNALHAAWQVITASSEFCWAAILQQFCCCTARPPSTVLACYSARPELICGLAGSTVEPPPDGPGAVAAFIANPAPTPTVAPSDVQRRRTSLQVHHSNAPACMVPSRATRRRRRGSSSNYLLLETIYYVETVYYTGTV